MYTHYAVINVWQLFPAVIFLENPYRVNTFTHVACEVVATLAERNTRVSLTKTKKKDIPTMAVLSDLMYDH